MIQTVTNIRRLLTPSERRDALALVGLMTVGAVLETAGISLVIPAISVLMRNDIAEGYPALRPVLHALGDPTERQLVAGGILTLVLVYVVKTVFCAWVIWRQTKFSFGLQARLSQRLFEIYLGQPYTFHLQRNSAELISNTITEIREFTNTAVLPSFMLLTEGLVLVGIASLLFVVQPLGAGVVVVVMGVLLTLFRRATGTLVAKWGAERQRSDGLRIQHLQQGFGAVKDIKLLGREEGFEAAYRIHDNASANAARRHHTLLELPRLGLELFAIVGLMALVVTMLSEGRETASIVPTLGLFAAAAFRLMPSVNRMISAFHLLDYGLPVVEKLSGELRLATPAPVVAKERASFQTNLTLANISYTYPAAPAQAISGLSLTIRRGESVGLIGPSGSGKTTLVDVILGLLTPDSGQVLVDGRDIQNNLRGWQDQIGYVPQSIYLTDDTIRRNVAFGLADRDIDNTAVARAVHAAQLDDVVAGRPDGVDAVLGERGVRLSGGQRQRMGIARALYHDPDVIVLDEATSSLDTATEKDVMDGVMALRGTKTIIVVAHRLSTVERCDRLYRLDEGRLVADGQVERSLRPKVSQA